MCGFEILTCDGAHGVQGGCGSILESQGDRTVGARPGEVEGLAGRDFLEGSSSVGEFNGLCDRKSHGGHEDLGELHF